MFRRKARIRTSFIAHRLGYLRYILHLPSYIIHLQGMSLWGRSNDTLPPKVSSVRVVDAVGMGRNYHSFIPLTV